MDDKELGDDQKLIVLHNAIAVVEQRMYQLKETFSGFNDPELVDGEHAYQDHMLLSFMNWKEGIDKYKDKNDARVSHVESFAHGMSKQ